MRISTRLLLIYAAVAVLAPSMAQAESEIQSRRGGPGFIPGYNLKLGAITFDANYRLDATYDDNSNRASDSSGEREQGVSLTNYVGLNMNWPVTNFLTLDAGFTLGYEEYFAGDGTGGFLFDYRGTGLVSTGDTFAAEMKIGDNALLSLIDDLSISAGDVLISDDADTEDLRILRNDLALQYEVDLSELISAQARIGHRIKRNLGASEFDVRDRNENYAAAGLDWRLNRDLSVGPYASYRSYEHVEDNGAVAANNDADEYEVGIEGTYQLTDYTALDMSVGYQNIEFDNDNNPGVGDDETSGLTASAGFVSQLSYYLYHSGYVKYLRRLGTSPFNNYSKDLRLSYNLNWIINDQWFTRFNFDWLHSEDSSDAFGETSDTYMPGVLLGYNVSEALSLHASYRRTINDSEDFESQDYTRDLYTVGLNYNF